MTNFPVTAGELVDIGWLNAIGMRLISDQVLGGSAANIDFPSIPGTFKHLLLVADLRGDAAVEQQSSLMRFNSDTGTNYEYETLQASSATVTSARNAGQTSIPAGQNAAASAGAGFSAPSFILIPNYAGTTFHKNVLALNAFLGTAAIGQFVGGRWQNTGAITDIKLLPGSGNFITGSRASLYGLA